MKKDTNETELMEAFQAALEAPAPVIDAEHVYSPPAPDSTEKTWPPVMSGHFCVYSRECIKICTCTQLQFLSLWHSRYVHMHVCVCVCKIVYVSKSTTHNDAMNLRSFGDIYSCFIIAYTPVQYSFTQDNMNIC